eukprot:GEMP01000005.1.p1 GENE.GEMP01000005.1~~GEMP01000005.1.p1  ORF type:complete len:5658 (+),score=908.41 GEMP01000005.1:558-17531(+)
MNNVNDSMTFVPGSYAAGAVGGATIGDDAMKDLEHEPENDYFDAMMEDGYMAGVLKTTDKLVARRKRQARNWDRMQYWLGLLLFCQAIFGLFLALYKTVLQPDFLYRAEGFLDPLELVVALDTSTTMRGSYNVHRTAFEHFLVSMNASMHHKINETRNQLDGDLSRLMKKDESWLGRTFPWFKAVSAQEQAAKPRVYPMDDEKGHGGLRVATLEFNSQIGSNPLFGLTRVDNVTSMMDFYPKLDNHNFESSASLLPAIERCQLFFQFGLAEELPLYITKWDEANNFACAPQFRQDVPDSNVTSIPACTELCRKYRCNMFNFWEKPNEHGIRCMIYRGECGERAVKDLPLVKAPGASLYIVDRKVTLGTPPNAIHVRLRGSEGKCMVHFANVHSPCRSRQQFTLLVSDGVASTSPNAWFYDSEVKASLTECSARKTVLEGAPFNCGPADVKYIPAKGWSAYEDVDNTLGARHSSGRYCVIFGGTTTQCTYASARRSKAFLDRLPSAARKWYPLEVDYVAKGGSTFESAEQFRDHCFNFVDVHKGSLYQHSEAKMAFVFYSEQPNIENVMLESPETRGFLREATQCDIQQRVGTNGRTVYSMDNCPNFIVAHNAGELRNKTDIFSENLIEDLPPPRTVHNDEKDYSFLWCLLFTFNFLFWVITSEMIGCVVRSRLKVKKAVWKHKNRKVKVLGSESKNRIKVTKRLVLRKEPEPRATAVRLVGSSDGQIDFKDFNKLRALLCVGDVVTFRARMKGGYLRSCSDLKVSGAGISYGDETYWTAESSDKARGEPLFVGDHIQLRDHKGSLLQVEEHNDLVVSFGETNTTFQLLCSDDDIAGPIRLGDTIRLGIRDDVVQCHRKKGNCFVKPVGKGAEYIQAFFIVDKGGAVVMSGMPIRLVSTEGTLTSNFDGDVSISQDVKGNYGVWQIHRISSGPAGCGRKTVHNVNLSHGGRLHQSTTNSGASGSVILPVTDMERQVPIKAGDIITLKSICLSYLSVVEDTEGEFMYFPCEATATTGSEEEAQFVVEKIGLTSCFVDEAIHDRARICLRPVKIDRFLAPERSDDACKEISLFPNGVCNEGKIEFEIQIVSLGQLLVHTKVSKAELADRKKGDTVIRVLHVWNKATEDLDCQEALWNEPGKSISTFRDKHVILHVPGKPLNPSFVAKKEGFVLLTTITDIKELADLALNARNNGGVGIIVHNVASKDSLKFFKVERMDDAPCLPALTVNEEGYKVLQERGISILSSEKRLEDDSSALSKLMAKADEVAREKDARSRYSAMFSAISENLRMEEEKQKQMLHPESGDAGIVSFDGRPRHLPESQKKYKWKVYSNPTLMWAGQKFSVERDVGAQGPADTGFHSSKIIAAVIKGMTGRAPEKPVRQDSMVDFQVFEEELLQGVECNIDELNAEELDLEQLPDSSDYKIEYEFAELSKCEMDELDLEDDEDMLNERALKGMHFTRNRIPTKYANSMIGGLCLITLIMVLCVSLGMQHGAYNFPPETRLLSPTASFDEQVPRKANTTVSFLKTAIDTNVEPFEVPPPFNPDTEMIANMNGYHPLLLAAVNNTDVDTKNDLFGLEIDVTFLGDLDYMWSHYQSSSLNAHWYTQCDFDTPSKNNQTDVPVKELCTKLAHARAWLWSSLVESIVQYGSVMYSPNGDTPEFAFHWGFKDTNASTFTDEKPVFDISDWRSTFNFRHVERMLEDTVEEAVYAKVKLVTDKKLGGAPLGGVYDQVGMDSFPPETKVPPMPRYRKTDLAYDATISFDGTYLMWVIIRGGSKLWSSAITSSSANPRTIASTTFSGITLHPVTPRFPTTPRTALVDRFIFNFQIHYPRMPKCMVVNIEQELCQLYRDVDFTLPNALLRALENVPLYARDTERAAIWTARDLVSVGIIIARNGVRLDLNEHMQMADGFCAPTRGLKRGDGSQLLLPDTCPPKSRYCTDKMIKQGVCSETDRARTPWRCFCDIGTHGQLFIPRLRYNDPLKSSEWASGCNNIMDYCPLDDPVLVTKFPYLKGVVDSEVNTTLVRRGSKRFARSAQRVLKCDSSHRFKVSEPELQCESLSQLASVEIDSPLAANWWAHLAEPFPWTLMVTQINTSVPLMPEVRKLLGDYSMRVLREDDITTDIVKDPANLSPRVRALFHPASNTQVYELSAFVHSEKPTLTVRRDPTSGKVTMIFQSRVRSVDYGFAIDKKTPEELNLEVTANDMFHDLVLMENLPIQVLAKKVTCIGRGIMPDGDAKAVDLCKALNGFFTLRDKNIPTVYENDGVSLEYRTNYDVSKVILDASTLNVTIAIDRTHYRPQLVYRLDAAEAMENVLLKFDYKTGEIDGNGLESFFIRHYMLPGSSVWYPYHPDKFRDDVARMQNDQRINFFTIEARREPIIKHQKVTGWAFWKSNKLALASVPTPFSTSPEHCTWNGWMHGHGANVTVISEPKPTFIRKGARLFREGHLATWNFFHSMNNSEFAIESDEDDEESVQNMTLVFRDQEQNGHWHVRSSSAPSCEPIRCKHPLPDFSGGNAELVEEAAWYHQNATVECKVGFAMVPRPQKLSDVRRHLACDQMPKIVHQGTDSANNALIIVSKFLARYKENNAYRIVHEATLTQQSPDHWVAVKSGAPHTDFTLALSRNTDYRWVLHSEKFATSIVSMPLVSRTQDVADAVWYPHYNVSEVALVTSACKTFNPYCRSVTPEHATNTLPDGKLGDVNSVGCDFGYVATNGWDRPAPYLKVTCQGRDLLMGQWWRQVQCLQSKNYCGPLSWKFQKAKAVPMGSVDEHIILPCDTGYYNPTRALVKCKKNTFESGTWFFYNQERPEGRNITADGIHVLHGVCVIQPNYCPSMTVMANITDMKTKKIALVPAGHIGDGQLGDTETLFCEDNRGWTAGDQGDTSVCSPDLSKPNSPGNGMWVPTPRCRRTVCDATHNPRWQRQDDENIHWISPSDSWLIQYRLSVTYSCKIGYCVFTKGSKVPDRDPGDQLVSTFDLQCKASGNVTTSKECRPVPGYCPTWNSGRFQVIVGNEGDEHEVTCVESGYNPEPVDPTQPDVKVTAACTSKSAFANYQRGYWFDVYNLGECIPEAKYCPDILTLLKQKMADAHMSVEKQEDALRTLILDGRFETSNTTRGYVFDVRCTGGHDVSASAISCEATDRNVGKWFVHPGDGSSPVEFTVASQMTCAPLTSWCPPLYIAHSLTTCLHSHPYGSEIKEAEVDAIQCEHGYVYNAKSFASAWEYPIRCEGKGDGVYTVYIKNGPFVNTWQPLLGSLVVFGPGAAANYLKRVHDIYAHGVPKLTKWTDGKRTLEYVNNHWVISTEGNPELEAIGNVDSPLEAKWPSGVRLEDPLSCQPMRCQTPEKCPNAQTVTDDLVLPKMGEGVYYICDAGHAVEDGAKSTQFVRQCTYSHTSNSLKYSGTCACNKVARFCHSMRVANSVQKYIPSLSYGEQFTITCMDGHVLRTSEDVELEDADTRMVVVTCGESNSVPLLLYNENIALRMIHCVSTTPLLVSTVGGGCPAKVLAGGEHLDAKPTGYVYGYHRVRGDERIQCADDSMLIAYSSSTSVETSIVCGGDPAKPTTWVSLPSRSPTFKCVHNKHLCAPTDIIPIHGGLRATIDSPRCPPNTQFVKQDSNAPAAICVYLRNTFSAGGQETSEAPLRGTWAVNGLCQENDYTCPSQRLVPFGPLIPHGSENSVRYVSTLPCDCGFQWSAPSDAFVCNVLDASFRSKNSTSCVVRSNYCPALRVYNGVNIASSSIYPENLWVIGGELRVRIPGHVVSKMCELQGNYTRVYSNGLVLYNSTDFLPIPVVGHNVLRKFIIPPQQSGAPKEWRLGVVTTSQVESELVPFPFTTLVLPSNNNLTAHNFMPRTVQCQRGFAPAENLSVRVVCEVPRAEVAAKLKWRNRMCDGTSDRGVWVSLDTHHVEQLYQPAHLTDVKKRLHHDGVAYYEGVDCEGAYISISRDGVGYAQGNWTVEGDLVLLPRSSIMCVPKRHFCTAVNLYGTFVAANKVVVSGQIGVLSNDRKLNMMEPAYIVCNPGWTNQTSIKPHDYNVYCSSTNEEEEGQFQWCRTSHSKLHDNCTMHEIPDDIAGQRVTTRTTTVYLCCKGGVNTTDYCSREQDNYCPEISPFQQPGLEKAVPKSAIGDTHVVRCQAGYRANPNEKIRQRRVKIGTDHQGDIMVDMPLAHCVLGGWHEDIWQEHGTGHVTLEYCVPIEDYCDEIPLNNRRYKLTSAIPSGPVTLMNQGVQVDCMPGWETPFGSPTWTVYCRPLADNSAEYLRKKYAPHGGRWHPEPQCQVRPSYCPAMRLSDNTFISSGDLTTQQNFQCQPGYELFRTDTTGRETIRRREGDMRCLERYVTENKRYLKLICAGESFMGTLLRIKERCTELADHLDSEGYCPSDPKMKTFCWTGGQTSGKWVVGVNSQTSLMTTVDGKLSWIYASYKALVGFWEHYGKYIPFDPPRNLKKWNNTLEAVYWPWMPSVLVNFGLGHEATGRYDLPPLYYSPDYKEGNSANKQPQYIKRQPANSASAAIWLFQPQQYNFYWVIMSENYDWHPGMHEVPGKLPVSSQAGITRFPTTATWMQKKVDATGAVIEEAVTLTEDVKNFKGDDRSITFDCKRRTCTFSNVTDPKFGIRRMEAYDSTTCQDKYDCKPPADILYWGEEVRYVCDDARGFLLRDRTRAYDKCDDDGLEPIVTVEQSPCVQRDDFCPDEEIWQPGSRNPIAFIPAGGLNATRTPICGSKVKLDHAKETDVELLSGAYIAVTNVICRFNPTSSEVFGTWQPLQADIALGMICTPKQNWCTYGATHGGIHLLHGTFPKGEVGVKIHERAKIICDDLYFWPRDAPVPSCDTYVNKNEYSSTITFFGGWNMHGYDYYLSRGSALEVECEPLSCLADSDPSDDLFGVSMTSSWSKLGRCSVLHSGPPCRTQKRGCCTSEGMCNLAAGFRRVGLAARDLITRCAFETLASSQSPSDADAVYCLDKEVVTCNRDDDLHTRGKWVWNNATHESVGPSCGLLVVVEVIDALTLHPINGSVMFGHDIPPVVLDERGLAFGLATSDTLSLTVKPNDKRQYDTSLRDFNSRLDCSTGKKYLQGTQRDVTECHVLIALAMVAEVAPGPVGITDNDHNAVHESSCAWQGAASTMRAVLTWKSKPLDLDLWAECVDCGAAIEKSTDIVGTNLNGKSDLWMWTTPWNHVGFTTKLGKQILAPQLWEKSEQLATSSVCPTMNSLGRHFLTPERLISLRNLYAQADNATKYRLRQELSTDSLVDGCVTRSTPEKSNINPKTKWVTRNTPLLRNLDRFYTIHTGEVDRIWRNNTWTFTTGDVASRNVWKTELAAQGIVVPDTPSSAIIFPSDAAGGAISAAAVSDLVPSISRLQLDTSTSTGLGPETVSFINVPPGQYNLVVFKPSLNDDATIEGDPSIVAANPEVRLYIGRQQIICQMTQCPSSGTPASLWYVATLRVESDAATKGYTATLTDFTVSSCKKQCRTKPTAWEPTDTVVTAENPSAFTFTRIPLRNRVYAPYERKPTQYGWIIESVPDQSNLSPGDLVTFIDGTDLATVHTMHDLKRILLDLGTTSSWHIVKPDSSSIGKCEHECGIIGIVPKLSHLEYPTTRINSSNGRTPKDPRLSSQNRYYKSMLDKEVVDDTNYLNEVCTGVCRMADTEVSGCLARPFGSY